MNKIALGRTVLAVAGVLTVLVACGGGDDDQAGGETAFSVSPNTQTLGYANGNACAGGGTGVNGPGFVKIGDFTVLGGTAPYQIHSSQVGQIIPNVTTVQDRNQQFSVEVIGCFTNQTITVIDALRRSATVTLNAASSV